MEVYQELLKLVMEFDSDFKVVLNYTGSCNNLSMQIYYGNAQVETVTHYPNETYGVGIEEFFVLLKKYNGLKKEGAR